MEGGKVVETGYPTGFLVQKGNKGKTQYKLDKEQIYYWWKKERKWQLGDKSTEYVQD
jgi:hypothetical protein